MFKRPLCALFFLLISAPFSFPQITNVTNDQTVPVPGAGHNYIKMVNETVNPASGSVSIRIGVPVPPGRRLSLPFAFTYDSNGVHHPDSSANGVMGWISDTTFLSEGGWSYSVPLLSVVPLTRTYTSHSQQVTCLFYSDYMFADPSGGRHSLRLSDWDGSTTNITNCTNDPAPPTIFTAAGDDYYQAITPTAVGWQGGSGVLPVMTASADGTVYSFPATYGFHVTTGGGTAALPSSIEDRNGNQISITDSGNGAFTITDTLGRAAVQSSGFGTSGNTVTVAGLPSNYVVNWTTATSGYAVNATTVFNDGYCNNFLNESSSPTPVVSSITLPNGKQYTFLYDGTYGLLKQITYPTGGWVKYSWGLNSPTTNSEFGEFNDTQGNPAGCQYTYQSAAVTERQVSFDGTNVALDQTFSYTTTWGSGGQWTQKTTTVTTTDKLRTGAPSFTTKYTYGPITVLPQPNEFGSFSPQVAVETEVDHKDWSGSALSTVTEAWQDQYLMKQQITQPAGGGKAEKDYTYSAFCGAQCTTYLLTDEKDYDYASSPPGTLLKETAISYWAPPAQPSIFGFNPTYYNTLLDRPSAVTVCVPGTSGTACPSSSANYVAAQTTYTYDGASLVQTNQSKPAYNHDYTNYPYTCGSPYTCLTRGNPTSKSDWLNTTGGSVTTSYTYDDTGQEQTMKDPNGNTPTQYSYTDSFYTSEAGCTTTPPQNYITNAYITQITDPLGFSDKYMYRYCDGQLHSSADPNNQVNGQSTTYSYLVSGNGEPLARLTGITYPDGGSTTYTYTDGSPTSSVKTTQTIDSTNSYVTTQTVDGIGQVKQTQLNNDPDCSSGTGNDNTDITYDGMGWRWKVSNPYCSASPDPRVNRQHPLHVRCARACKR